MSQLERATFGSKLGIILATAGSAVGLGNVWRFPYMAGENGGAAFMILYFLCVILLGIPCMMSEFIIGRHAKSNAARAYRKLGGRTPLAAVGYFGVLTGILIMSYYAVVSGWCLQYVYASAAGHFIGAGPDYVSDYFTAFEKDPVRPVIWTVAFLIITHFIVVRGVRDGIEKASKVMMPAMFILLLLIVAVACMLPGAGKGVRFLLSPDFNKVDSNVMLNALGQAFYSLSIGMGCVCTYASYFGDQTRLGRSAVQVSLIDTVVAVLAGLMIFPVAFSVGISPDSGPSLIFITLPNVFLEAFSFIPELGYLVALLFYALLSLAALTSLISLHEVSTSFFHEELHVSRSTAALIVTSLCSVLGAFCSLSLGGYDWATLFGKPLFSLFDFVTGQVMLPLGGFLTCLLVGWYMPRKIVHDQYTNWDSQSGMFFRLYLFAVRFVCPVCIVMIFLHELGVI